MPDAVGQNFIIGDPRSPSASVRSEWLLNQIRLAVAASASPPNYTVVLSSILAAVDDLELKADQVNLTNAQINLNVDDVETLLTASNQRLLTISTNLISTLVSNLQNGTKLDSLIANANLDSATLGAMALDLAQMRTEQPYQSLFLSQSVNLLTALSGETIGIIGPEVTLVRQNLDAMRSVLNSINSWNASISNNLYDQIGYLQQIQGALFRAEQQIKLTVRNVFDASQLVGGQVQSFSPTAQFREAHIINCTGDRTGNPKFRGWVYGKFWDNASNQPSPKPDYYDHDFSVEPGDRLNLEKNSNAGFDITVEGGGSETGNIIVNQFELF